MSGEMLNEEITKQIKDLFDKQFVHPVEVIYFSKKEPCETCESTYQLLQEVTAISDKIKLSSFDLSEHASLAEKYHIQLAPSFVITSNDGETSSNIGLHFSGIPSGYEFSSFIQGIILISKQDSGLKPNIREELKKISAPVYLKVFVTPT